MDPSASPHDNEISASQINFLFDTYFPSDTPSVAAAAEDDPGASICEEHGEMTKMDPTASPHDDNLSASQKKFLVDDSFPSDSPNVAAVAAAAAAEEDPGASICEEHGEMTISQQVHLVEALFFQDTPSDFAAGPDDEAPIFIYTPDAAPIRIPPFSLTPAPALPSAPAPIIRRCPPLLAQLPAPLPPHAPAPTRPADAPISICSPLLAPLPAPHSPTPPSP